MRTYTAYPRTVFKRPRTLTLYGIFLFFCSIWVQLFANFSGFTQYTLRAISQVHEDKWKTKPVIYLTNGCTYNQFLEMMHVLKKPAVVTDPPVLGKEKTHRPEVWFLRRK
jgi:hypothetical protein